jgi:hypothetical protein
MDGRAPFSASAKEKTDLRNIFKLVSSGGNPYHHQELKDVYPVYKTVFDIFDICIDARYGNFIHLPFSGGVIEQGVKTMDVLKYLQYLFRKKIEEDAKKHTPPRPRR